MSRQTFINYRLCAKHWAQCCGPRNEENEVPAPRSAGSGGGVEPIESKYKANRSALGRGEGRKTPPPGGPLRCGLLRPPCHPLCPHMPRSSQHAMPPRLWMLADDTGSLGQRPRILLLTVRELTRLSASVPVSQAPVPTGQHKVNLASWVGLQERNPKLRQPKSFVMGKKRTCPCLHYTGQ